MVCPKMILVNKIIILIVTIINVMNDFIYLHNSVLQHSQQLQQLQQSLLCNSLGRGSPVSTS